MPKSDYNTKSRKYIIEFLTQKSDTTVSVADILEFLSSKGISVNFTTVYRFLNKLTLEHKVIKFSGEKGQKAVFQLARPEKSCKEHIHITCVNCGKLVHLDCGFMNELSDHLASKHGFNLKCEGSILYGICDNCRKNNAK